MLYNPIHVFSIKLCQYSGKFKYFKFELSYSSAGSYTLYLLSTYLPPTGYLLATSWLTGNYSLATSWLPGYYLLAIYWLPNGYLLKATSWRPDNCPLAELLATVPTVYQQTFYWLPPGYLLTVHYSWPLWHDRGELCPGLRAHPPLHPAGLMEEDVQGRHTIISK